MRELETDPFFNSGRGSALTEKGTVEMEASIMDGPKRRCGAVSGLTTVKNPISLARLVMDKSPHSYLAFSGAEDFARQQVCIFTHFGPYIYHYQIEEPKSSFDSINSKKRKKNTPVFFSRCRNLVRRFHVFFPVPHVCLNNYFTRSPNPTQQFNNNIGCKKQFNNNITIFNTYFSGQKSSFLFSLWNLYGIWFRVSGS